ncbi:MAG: prenyltransferase [Chthoniobacterales bacterium]
MNAAILWRATRAFSLPASVVPVLLGTVLAARGYGQDGAGRFDLVTFLLALFGAMLAHIGANVLNDYFDFARGVDTRPEHGSGVLTRGEMTSGQVAKFALVLFSGAALCGLFLLRAHLLVVLPLALIGFGSAVLYPSYLKRFGLGDVLIVIAFGLGITLGAYGVQVDDWSWTSVLWIALCSLPICLLVDAILHANNLRDAEDDRGARVRTLATVLSPGAARGLQRILLFGPLVFVVAGVAVRFLPLWSLATFAALPLLLRANRTGSVEGTAQTHLVFGVLYTTAFLFRPVFL